MNINIAFNTIIYIMVFLFPGFLFRRTFFSGDFKDHFESGNTFERLLWNMFTSIVILVIFCGFIHYYNIFSPVKIEFELQIVDITDTFICIYENKLPTIFISEIRITQALNLLLSIYFFSGLLGYSMNKFIFYLGLEKRYYIFKFQNNWKYLTNSNKQNNLSHGIGDIFYTIVDIKTEENELFTGKLHMISYDKEGKIETITIQDAYKHYNLSKVVDNEKIKEIKNLISVSDPHIIEHSETDNNFKYRKRIKGDLFTIFNNELANISITYIKISNFYKKFQKILKTTISILILLVTVFSISYAIWDFHLIQFSNYYKRLSFCIVSPLFFVMFILTLINIFNTDLYGKNRKKYIYSLKSSILTLILFSIPYLYIFNTLKIFYVTVVLAVYFIVLGRFFQKNPSID